MNLQVMAGPVGQLLWVSGELPGSVHDMKAAWIWGIEHERAAADLPALADKGYQGAAHAKTPAVTQALLHGITDVTGKLAERDRAIDALYQEIEQLVGREILLQAPVASDLRFLLTVLRIAPELERTHDLECQIASRVGRPRPEELSQRSRSLIERMGELTADMWSHATDSWHQRDASAASALTKLNDEMRDLYASLIAELASGGMLSSVTIEMALVARFYGRLGDHAVNIVRRVGYLAGLASG